MLVSQIFHFHLKAVLLWITDNQFDQSFRVTVSCWFQEHNWQELKAVLLQFSEWSFEYTCSLESTCSLLTFHHTEPFPPDPAILCNRITFIWSLCVYVHLCMCAYACVSAHKYRPEVSVGVSSSILYLFSVVSLTVPGAHGCDYTGWPARPEMLLSLPPSTEVTDMTWHPMFLRGWWRFELRSLGLHGKHFNEWAISPAQGHSYVHPNFVIVVGFNVSLPQIRGPWVGSLTRRLP